MEDQNVYGDVYIETDLPGVTPEMIDWWWVNIEKGYALWKPEMHKTCVWEIAPTPGNHIGSIHIARETLGGNMPVMDIRIRWEPLSDSPMKIDLDHAVLAAGVFPNNQIAGYVLHQYKAIPKGTFLRSSSKMLMPLPPGAHEIWKNHARREDGRFPHFLPELYKLWQVVKDPEINRQTNMKVKLPTHRAGLSANEILFILCPLTPPTRRGFRGTWQ